MRPLFLSVRVLIFLTVLVLPFGARAEKSMVPDEIFDGHKLIEDWDIAEAERLTLRLLENYPESGDAHFLNARVQFMTGHYDFAWNILKQVEDSHRSVKEFKTLVKNTREATRNFISQESKHFIFLFEEGPDEILAHYAEQALEKSYTVLGKLLNYYPEEKVRVEIYPDRKKFSRISPLTLKDIVTSGTVALCKYHRIMMISPGSLIRGYNWLDTLSHEYTHYLLTKKSHNHLPLWMHEGIAKYLESRWRDEKDFLTPVMETVLATGLANDYMISLESMMPSLAKLKTAEDVQLAYAEVSSMMEYIVQVRGEEFFPLLLQDLAQGVSFETSLENLLGMDLATLQENWRQFMKPKLLKIVPGLKALTTRFKKDRNLDEEHKDYSEVEIKKAQDLVYLGDILKSRNIMKAAIIEYRKAIQETESLSPVIYNKLASTYLITRKYDEAEILLKKSMEYYPMFHTTLVTLGELYFESDRMEQARDYFERAVRVNPFNPFVHTRLIHIYQKLGLEKEKKMQTALYHFIK